MHMKELQDVPTVDKCEPGEHLTMKMDLEGVAKYVWSWGLSHRAFSVDSNHLKCLIEKLCWWLYSQNYVLNLWNELQGRATKSMKDLGVNFSFFILGIGTMLKICTILGYGSLGVNMILNLIHI